MIVATAGHVDHGKTTIVRSLTGVDTDRLPEEKSRGLTIDLGFAYSELEGGGRLGFVDVPGHERFVKNMLAGVSTIDFALLVVAADDGPMPQTREHLDILTLLGIPRGAIVLSKIDRAAPERLDEVEAAIRNVTAASILDGAPLFRVSGTAGTGMAELKAFLQTEARQQQARAAEGHFRLAVDRVFTLQGTGLVVTGAAFAGRVAVGDRLTLSPRGLEVRVRGLRVQGGPAESGQAGDRCALNITAPGLERDGIRRGDWLIAPQLHQPTERLDVEFRLLPGEAKGFKHWTPAHLHLGASDVTCRIALLQGSELAPGASMLTRLVLDEPIPALAGDRFVLRDQSAQRTFGGGRIVDPYPPARGRARPERLAVLEALCAEDPVDALTDWLVQAPRGVDLNAFARARNLTPDETQAVVDLVGPVVLNLPEGPRALQPERWQSMADEILAILAERHRREPESVGPSESMVRSALARPLPPELLKAAVEKLARDGVLVKEGVSLRLPGHKAKLPARDEKLWQAIEPILEATGVRAPRVREIAEEIRETPEQTESFLRRAARRGQVYAVAKNRFFPPESIRELAALAETLAGESPDGTFDASTYKDRSGIGRNVTIEVLEFFDSAGFTRRDGNVRKVMRKSTDVFGGD